MAAFVQKTYVTFILGRRIEVDAIANELCLRRIIQVYNECPFYFFKVMTH
jgi:hypothetical protein